MPLDNLKSQISNLKSRLVEHLYIHIPFCHRVCPYCSFHKHTPGATDMSAFVRAVLDEIAIHQRSIAIKPRTIYFGGGTPTMLSETHLAALLGGLRQELDTSALVEFCTEANPRTIGPAKAKLLRDHGITRVSLGVQSWNEDVLHTLGRDHSPAEAEETYFELRESGIPSVNIDLMFSIPGQTAEVWRATLEKSISLQPDHLSAYNLTYEEDTEFLKKLGEGRLDSDTDRDADHFFLGMEMLQQAGFEHYEISNYARPGNRSVHNESYWSGADYLGLGPSAVSTISRHRWKNIADTMSYMRSVKEGRVPVTESEELSDDMWRTERVALELRTTAGVNPSRHGLNLSQSAHLESLGLLHQEGTQLRLTPQGMALADQIAGELLS